MSKKIHGWSKRNQGGFSKGGPVKQIYRKPQKIDQTQTLQQAAGLGLVLQSFCCNPACLKRTKERVLNKIADFPKIADLTLSELKKKAKCSKCQMEQTLELTFTPSLSEQAISPSTPIQKKPKTKAIKYEASIAQNVFHRSTCGWLRNTSLKNTIQFRDRVEAIQQGFMPCKNCRP